MSAHIVAGPVLTGGEALAPALNLYRFPHLYDVLKAPDDGDVAVVRELIERFVGPAPWAILDPACGPGNWLRPFAPHAALLAGNDNCPEMVEYTRAYVGAHTVLGDMYDPQLPHTFDVILEASGVTSLVPDAATLCRWVGTLGSLLSKGGAVVLLMNFETPPAAELPAALWQSDWRPVPGGFARIRYDLLADMPGAQRIRRTVETEGGGWPPMIVEDYDLSVWPSDTLQALAAPPGMRLRACVDAANGQAADAQGERLLVFTAG